MRAPLLSLFLLAPLGCLGSIDIHEPDNEVPSDDEEPTGSSAPVGKPDDVTVTGHAFRPELVPATDERVAALKVADGFRLSVYARDLVNPRMIINGPSGLVYVTEKEAGRITALVDANADGVAEKLEVAAGLTGIHGLAYRPGQLFAATDTTLYAIDLNDVGGPLSSPRIVLDDLPTGGQHPNRSMAFGPDGALYLSVGSTCNACDEPNEENATILRVDLEAQARTIFATGLRNTIGFAWQPTTQLLFGLDHGSDMLGDDIPPEEVNQIVEGKSYGWPYCYADRQIDPVVQPPTDTTRDAFCAASEPSVFTLPAHAAPMQLVFLDESTALATLRGSWNRKEPQGYKVVRLHFEGARPTAVDDFVSGFLLEGGRQQMGRLVGLALLPDGTILFGDDDNGVIYRVTSSG